jgi:hypothetical protein
MSPPCVNRNQSTPSPYSFKINFNIILAPSHRCPTRHLPFTFSDQLYTLLFMYLVIHLYTHLPIYLFIYLVIYLLICLTINMYLFTRPFICGVYSMAYLTMTSAARTIQRWMTVWWIKWKGSGRQRLWSNLRKCPGICLKELRKPTEKPQNSRSSGHYLNPNPPEQEAGVPTFGHGVRYMYSSHFLIWSHKQYIQSNCQLGDESLIRFCI